MAAVLLFGVGTDSHKNEQCHKTSTTTRSAVDAINNPCSLLQLTLQGSESPIGQRRVLLHCACYASLRLDVCEALGVYFSVKLPSSQTAI